MEEKVILLLISLFVFVLHQMENYVKQAESFGCQKKQYFSFVSLSFRKYKTAGNNKHIFPDRKISYKPTILVGYFLTQTDIRKQIWRE